ncbi:hypothetical protein [Litorihabitans aurantiacus]|uniref:UbiC transcription regulator-associated domain-containing protein n=1 Tax=Litorihabitans aurantiacus TaxID=1930061 RepID=A0AA37XHR6_9MICO|nr:hypothetical protein [Litorihabitans aurantiacus]GMA33157.1 hypothetical protein GCM10025875_31490 [Litorihabitans aurantiacus]
MDLLPAGGPRSARAGRGDAGVRRGTFAYLESHGAEIGVAQVRTGASLADPGVAQLLEIPRGHP